MINYPSLQMTTKFQRNQVPSSAHYIYVYIYIVESLFLVYKIHSRKHMKLNKIAVPNFSPVYRMPLVVT